MKLGNKKSFTVQASLVRKVTIEENNVWGEYSKEVIKTFELPSVGGSRQDAGIRLLETSLKRMQASE